MAFFGLKQEAKVQGDAHRAIATDLRALALDPFSSWAKGHEQRIRDARINLLDIWLREYEQSIGEVNKLRSTYHMKTRKADEAEDEYVMSVCPAIDALLISWHLVQSLLQTTTSTIIIRPHLPA